MHNKLVIFDCFGVIMGEVAPVFLRKHLAKEVADPLKEKLFVPADLGLVTYDELMTNMAITNTFFILLYFLASFFIFLYF